MSQNSKILWASVGLKGKYKKEPHNINIYINNYRAENRWASWVFQNQHMDAVTMIYCLTKFSKLSLIAWADFDQQPRQNHQPNWVGGIAFDRRCHCAQTRRSIAQRLMVGQHAHKSRISREWWLRGGNHTHREIEIKSDLCRVEVLRCIRRRPGTGESWRAGDCDGLAHHHRATTYGAIQLRCDARMV